MDNRFKEIFDLYKNDIYRLSYSYSKNFTEADDITQKVFIKLYSHKEIMEKDNTEVKKNLIRSTVNESKTFLKSLWRKRVVLFDSIENEKKKEENIENSNVLDAILKLPKKQRTIIFLYYYENYKIKEIKDLLNISETNIQSILLRARKKLKELLKEDNIDE